MRRQYINILGVDPSLSNFGCVRAKLNLHNMRYQILQMALFETKPQPKMRGIRKNAVDFDRCRSLNTGFQHMQATIDVVMVEMPHGSQSARAAASYGMCLGVLSQCGKPLIQVTAEQVKLAAVGDRVASKKDMINWARNKHPNAGWLTRGRRLLNKNEHLADAIGAIEAALKTEDFAVILAHLQRDEDEFWQ